MSPSKNQTLMKEEIKIKKTLVQIQLVFKLPILFATHGSLWEITSCNGVGKNFNLKLVQALVLVLKSTIYLKTHLWGTTKGF